ncbi:aldehyde dehydrogenase family protein [Candidatus Pantoea multigeneris]|uniref:Aldehyde dehydrogenase family protein n=1 Tax=Candidatus Pantoea multigeneris TaxID=2608357 RepID=A0ABX0RAR2_9GAMM|nr:aldehyde dehydrogenase family protein [Pantoea multigeneris]NIF21613.1 aldehyde dehydrogenase family protein [Pantoea multigeneris]
MSATTQLFINGQWVNPRKGENFATIDPDSEKEIARIAAATREDVDLAVQAARNAFDNGGWPELSGKARAGYLRRIASLIREKQQMLAELEVRDNGKPLPEALWDIGDTAYCFDFYADLAEKLDNQREQAVALTDDRFSSLARKEPIGVCGAIIPWNFPMLMAAWKVAPALAAGCTVVLKPSEVTPLTALQLADIAHQAELPAGVLNVITGLGHEAGSALTEHPDVDKLAFTGSVPTGRKIMQVAATEIKNVSLELGGKSAFILFDDSDIEKAVEWILFGIFWNKGEVCSATSRVLVQRNLYQPLMKRLVEEAEKIKIGNGMDEGVLLGPLVNEAQYKKVQSAIAQGIEQGATLLSGGKRPQGHDKGYYLQPTIFTEMTEESELWREEIFGPVVCVRAFDEEAEAIASANRSRFGLAAAVMSEDLERAERVARKLRAGIVWINCSQPTFTEAPWGGYKQSGIGRELGEWGLNNYLETKQITRYDSDEPWGWYLK